MLSIAGESIYEEDNMNEELYIVVLGAVSLRDQESISVKGPGGGSRFTFVHMRYLLPPTSLPIPSQSVSVTPW